MYSPKNLSPLQLSLLAAAAIAVPGSLLLGLVEQNWLLAFYYFVFLFLGSFAIILFTFNRFLYRKIKLIYKFIYQTKTTKRDEVFQKYVLPKKNITAVSNDVEAWASEKIQEIETLQKNEQFRKEFLQNLSHEFKTPVFAIQGYIESLLDGDLKNEETNRRFLTNASKNITRLTQLIQDLDEISKLERGELLFQPSNFILQELVKEVFETLSRKAGEKQINFYIKKGCELPLTVFADKEKIRQVLINLIDNSIKYGKENGSVTASMYLMDERHILAEISDDGIGIAEKHIARIFERFYRTDEGRSREIAGSGLGLAICKHIIEIHKQTIHVRSTETVGTTVGFTLETYR